MHLYPYTLLMNREQTSTTHDTTNTIKTISKIQFKLYKNATSGHYH